MTSMLLEPGSLRQIHIQVNRLKISLVDAYQVGQAAQDQIGHQGGRQAGGKKFQGAAGGFVQANAQARGIDAVNLVEQ